MSEKNKTKTKKLNRLSEKALKNPWLKHVDETIGKNPKVSSYREILKLAAKSYKKKINKVKIK
jgi:hypothetical protein